MTTSMIPLQLVLVSHICIYLPSPLMMDPACIKKSRYTQDQHPAAISFASANSVNTLTTPSDFPDLLPSDDPTTLPAMKKYVTFQGRLHKGYCCRKHGQIIYYNKKGYISPHALIRTIKFIVVMCFSGLFQRQGLAYWNTNIIYHNFSVYCCVFLHSILYFTC